MSSRPGGGDGEGERGGAKLLPVLVRRRKHRTGPIGQRKTRWANGGYRPIADTSYPVTVLWMNMSIGATNAIKGLLAVVLLAAFSAFVFTGERSNQMLLSTAHAPASVCRSH